MERQNGQGSWWWTRQPFGLRVPPCSLTNFNPPPLELSRGTRAPAEALRRRGGSSRHRHRGESVAFAGPDRRKGYGRSRHQDRRYPVSHLASGLPPPLDGCLPAALSSTTCVVYAAHANKVITSCDLCSKIYSPHNVGKYALTPSNQHIQFQSSPMTCDGNRWSSSLDTLARAPTRLRGTGLF